MTLEQLFMPLPAGELGRLDLPRRPTPTENARARQKRYRQAHRAQRAAYMREYRARRAA